MTSVAVDATVRARNVHARLDVASGEVVAVVGPNGAGKSTLVRLLSGQLRPDEGTVRIGAELVSGPDRHVPVHRRRVALLEQRPLLFEHLDVAANVAFGPLARGVARRDAFVRAAAELEAVGCAHLARRRTWEISGGEAQRIALARALATDPEVVLLDEPLAALDVSVAPAIRTLLRERLREEQRTTILVTHDLVDALTLADTLVVMGAGRVTASGPLADLVARPTDPFLADLVGVNLVRGVRKDDTAIVVASGETITGVAAIPLAGHSDALAAFAPAAVAVHAELPVGSPRNHLRAHVTGIEPRGGLVRLACALSDGSTVAADVTAAAVAEGRLRPGAEVWLVVKAAQVSLYPR